MKKFLIIFFSLVLFACNGQTKSSDTSDHSKIIKAQAERMGQLLLKKDFKSFMKFTYPKIIDMIGGQEKMIQIMEKGSIEMESEGTGVLSVNFGDPSEILTEGNELQCTLPEVIEMKVPNGRLVTKSTLIAVSTDSGKNWFFIDTSNKDLQTLRKGLPNLSSELIIPEHQQPTFYKE